MTQPDEALSELRRDLLDGDDLAMALSLIGDVYHRRIRRVRRSLGDLPADTEPAIERIVERMIDSLDRHERQLDQQHGALSEVIADLQSGLEHHAEALEDAVDDAEDDA